MDDDADVEKQNRVLLRPWLENMLETECIPGLEWFDAEKTMFKVPWKHRSKKDWSMRHSSVFLEWAKNTGRWSEGDPPPNFAQLKTRLRCAFNKAPDIDEMKECHCSKGEEPFKVYRFNTRRGDLKAALLGQKSCQKTVGSRQGRILGSPAVLKYESCEEEVVDDDDNAIYREAEIHSLTFSSGESASGFGKFEMGKVEIGQNCLSTVSGNDPTWSYRGCVPQCDSKDSKLPVIPLTVELMTSSSLNDDSDCDGESPNNVWRDSSNRNVSVSMANDVLQTTVKREVLSENIDQIKTKEMQKSDSEDSADKMHLLQMASLFVEAAERKKEKEIQEDNETPEQPTAVHMDPALSQYPSNHYMIIMPSHCEFETQNEGSVTSGYVTPTSNDITDVKLPFQEPTSPKTSVGINFAESGMYQLEVAGVDAPELYNLKKFEETDSVKVTDSVQKKDEAVDLTKSSNLVKSSAASEGLQSDCQAVGKIQPLGCGGSRNIEAAKIQLSFQSGGDGLTISTQAANDVLMPLSEQSTMDQIKRYLGKRSEQTRHQLEWENHLRSWENRLRSWESRLQSWDMQLQSKEETLYWRDRCLQSELGINSRPVLNCQRSKELAVCCDNSVLTLASSKQPHSLKDMLTLTPSTPASSSCSSVIVSTGLLSSGINKESKAASVINQEMTESQLNRNCLQGNKHFGLAHPLNQLANNLCPIQVKESGGKPDGEQLNLSKSYGVCGTMSSDVQSVSVMSLIASNQGVPMIVPFIVRQNLLPPAQSLNPDTGLLIRNCLDSKSSAKGATLLNVVDGVEAKRCSLGENTKILSAQSDSDKSLHYNESNSCSQVSGLDVQILESTLEKVKAAVNLEKEIEQDGEEKNKLPVSVLDCSPQNMNCVENSDLKHLDSASPESNKSLHTISFIRNSQKGHKSKYDTTTLVGCVASSDHPEVQSESKNCQFNSTIPTELKPEAVPKALQKIIVSFPQVNLSVASGQTTTWACSKSPTDFRNWLRAKTEIICKEESLEGRKNIEDNADRSRHCSEDDDNQCSSKSEFKIQMINQDDSRNHLQHDLNLLSASDANAALVPSPALTPQVPLVVENENDLLETDSADDSVAKSSHFSSTNIVKKRKQSFEKQNSFKKVIVDALL